MEIRFYHPTPTLQSEPHCHRSLWQINIDMHFKKGRTASRILCLLVAIQKNGVAVISLCLPEVVRPEEEPSRTCVAPHLVPLSIHYSTLPGT